MRGFKKHSYIASAFIKYYLFSGNHSILFRYQFVPDILIWPIALD